MLRNMWPLSFAGRRTASSLPPGEINFESGSLPSQLYAYGWTIISAADATGGTTKALTNPDIGDNEGTAVIFDATFNSGSGNLVVRYAVSSESAFSADRFYIIVDGTTVYEDSGTGGGWEVATLTVSAGAHRVVLGYGKDVSTTVGTDDVRISKITINGSYSTAPSPASSPFTFASIPEGFNDATRSNWYGVSDADSGAGTSIALASKDINDGQTTEFKIVGYFNSGSGNLVVRYKVASEAGYDFFRIYYRGHNVGGDQLLHTDSGTGGGWEEATLTVPQGYHWIVFRYSKDGSASSGTDDVRLSKVTVNGTIFPY